MGAPAAEVSAWSGSGSHCHKWEGYGGWHELIYVHILYICEVGGAWGLARAIYTHSLSIYILDTHRETHIGLGDTADEGEGVRDSSGGEREKQRERERERERVHY